MGGLPPAALYGVIGGLAAAENIFPPVPADTAVAIGAFLTNWGAISPLGVFLVTWLANVGSAAGVYGGARTVGRRFFVSGVGRRILKPGALERIEGLYRRHGIWGIFLSRFIPGIRAVVPPFAGVAGLDPWRALAPMALASAIWYGTLTAVIATLASRLEDVGRLLGQVNVAALAVVLTLAALVGLVTWWRRRRR